MQQQGEYINKETTYLFINVRPLATVTKSAHKALHVHCFHPCVGCLCTALILHAVTCHMSRTYVLHARAHRVRAKPAMQAALAVVMALAPVVSNHRLL
jgi:hypothetical protein